MTYSIRNMDREDIVSVINIINNSSEFVTARTMSDYWLYSSLFSNTCPVYMRDNNILGVIISFLDQNKNFTECYIQDVAVYKDHFGQGIGYALMKHLLSKLQSIGCHRAWLTSEIENERAMSLWNKFGMKNIESDYISNGFWVTKDLKGPGKDRIIFEIDL